MGKYLVFGLDGGIIMHVYIIKLILCLWLFALGSGSRVSFVFIIDQKAVHE